MTEINHEKRQSRHEEEQGRSRKRGSVLLKPPGRPAAFLRRLGIAAGAAGAAACLCVIGLSLSGRLSLLTEFGSGRSLSVPAEKTAEEDFTVAEGNLTAAESDISGPESGASQGGENRYSAGSRSSDGSGQSDAGAEAQNTGSAPASLLVAGDIYLSDYVLDTYDGGGIDAVLGPGLAEEVSESELFLANEEFPFSSGGSPAPDKQFTFRVSPERVRLMQDMHLDVLTLANNHILDFGTEAMLDTCRTLDRAGIARTGAGENIEDASRLLKLPCGNKTVGILAASRVIPVAGWAAGGHSPGVLAAYDPSALLQAVREADSQVDYLIVAIHWGLEKHTAPEPYQRELGHALIDAGADLVAGSHPHVLQGIEYYADKPILYSLGNFIFYQSIPSTMVAKITFEESGPALRLIPARADNACTDKLPESKWESFFAQMRELSPGCNIDEKGKVTKSHS